MSVIVHRLVAVLAVCCSCAAVREGAEGVAGYGMTLNPSDPARLERGAHGIEGVCANGSIAWIVPVSDVTRSGLGVRGDGHDDGGEGGAGGGEGANRAGSVEGAGRKGGAGEGDDGAGNGGGAGDVVLVDAGFEDSGDIIRAALHGRRVVAVLLTHGHLDHRAAAAAFDAPVYVGRRDMALVDATYAYPHLPGVILGALGVPAQPARPRAASSRPAALIPVDDGDVLSIGGRAFRAIAMPGHSPGSTAWLTERTLFSGDAALAPFGDALAPPPEGYSDDEQRAWDSLARVSFRVDVDEVLDGHFGRTILTPALWARTWRKEARGDEGADRRPWGCAAPVTPASATRSTAGTSPPSRSRS